MAKINIGLQQASRLTQMGHAERLDLIAEGLPIVLESAKGFLAASNKLEDDLRESNVLLGFAEEEAAKALILIDIVRCPPKIISSKMGSMIKWFYSHLARLLYAEACSWKPMHVSQLQEYINRHRNTHYVDGDYGEYIFSNHQIYTRESKLYADLGAYEDGKLFWNVPETITGRILRCDPPANKVIDALYAVGAFSKEGVKVVANVWSQVDFHDSQNWQDSDRLTKETLECLEADNLLHEDIIQDQIYSLYNDWQLPMYNINLRSNKTTWDDLNNQREALSPYEY